MAFIFIVISFLIFVVSQHGREILKPQKNSTNAGIQDQRLCHGAANGGTTIDQTILPTGPPVYPPDRLFGSFSARESGDQTRTLVRDRGARRVSGESHHGDGPIQSS
jgi:hypothetical protein